MFYVNHIKPPRFTVLSSDEKLGVGLGTRLVASYAIKRKLYCISEMLCAIE